MDEHDKKIPITGTGTYRILSHKTEMVKFPTNKKRENKNRKTREKERKKMSESKASKRKQTASNIRNSCLRPVEICKITSKNIGNASNIVSKCVEKLRRNASKRVEKRRNCVEMRQKTS